MTAWDILVQNSTLTSGTAWNHLNAQVGGTIVNYGLSVEVDLEDVEICEKDPEEVLLVEDCVFLDVDDREVGAGLVSESGAIDLDLPDAEIS